MTVIATRLYFQGFIIRSKLEILKKTTSSELDQLIVFLHNNKGPDATVSTTIV